jgi:hypothetical protein
MSAPHKAQSPAATGLSGFQNTNTAILTEADEARKRFDTLAARAASKGHVLQKLGSGYLLSKWGHVRHFIDLDTAEALIVRMEGGKS